MIISCDKCFDKKKQDIIKEINRKGIEFRGFKDDYFKVYCLI